jgi:hypothetical protein
MGFVIVICEVYVTAISLGCQYNAPDISKYSLISSSAVPLGPSDTRVPFESHYNRLWALARDAFKHRACLHRLQRSH